MFSMLSVPRLYNEDRLALRDNLETVVRRVGGWCEMSPASEDVSAGAEECPLLKDVPKQSSEDRDCEHYSVCDSDL
jgi:hypothetical protein